MRTRRCAIVIRPNANDFTARLRSASEWPSGPPIAEVLDAGLGLVRGVIALPNPRVRLHTGDRARVARFAQRFAGAACVALDHRARITVEDGRAVAAAETPRLAEDGALDRSWP